MNRLTIIALLLIGSAQSLATTLTDPCENAADKFACIQGKIDEQHALISARITYLNEEPGPTGQEGPKGVMGPQGEAGAKGDTGPAGRDTKQQLASDFSSRNGSLFGKTLTLGSQIENPNIHFGLIELQNIDAIPRRLANLNRNPDLIGITPDKRSEGDLAWLDFPQDSEGNYLDSFTHTFEQALYVVDVDNNDSLRTGYPFGETPNPELVDDVAEYCVLQPDSLFCSDDIANRAASRYMDSIDLEELKALPQSLTITSGREFSIYRMGMDADDPAFLMVVDGLLEQFEDPAFSSAVIQNMDDVLATLDTTHTLESNHLNNLIDNAQNTEDTERFQAELDALNAEHQVSKEAVENGQTLFRSLSSDEYGLRRERLISYINDSDLLYVSLIHQTIKLYWQYKENPASMTEEEIAAWTTFENRFLFFAEKFSIQWRNAATQEKDLFFQNYVGSSLGGLLGSPNTPDFVDAGAARVGDLYLDKQPQALQDWQVAMASATVATSLVGVTAAGFAISAGIGSAAASGTTALGLFSAFGTTSLSAASSALGGLTGVASAAAAPVAIAVVAITAGVIEGVRVFDQGEKDKRYEALMDYYIVAHDPGSLHNIDLPIEDRKNMINNILYMWMISNSQVATN